MDQDALAAKKLKFLLQQQNVSPRDLAERLGTDPEAVMDILDGRATPPLNLLQRICALFGMNINYFRESSERRPLVPDSRGPGAAGPIPEEASEAERPNIDPNARSKTRRAASPSSLSSRERAFSELMVAKTTRRSEKDPS